jgi:hypothetical protein
MNNEEKARTLLKHLAEEIPDDMDLWNDIQRKAKPAFTERRPAQRSLRTVLITAAILVMIVGSAYAVYQTLNINASDPGLQNVADLLTPLNLTQSLPDDDVNVTLVWAYADGHRVAVAFEIDYANTLLVPTLVTGRLTDTSGTEYTSAQFLGFGGGGGGGGGERAFYGSTLSFDTTGITGNPESLSLHLILRADHTENAAEMGGGSGGGGGGGGSAQSDIFTTVEPFELTFDFEVPFIAARRSEDTVTQTVNGLSMSLSGVSVAPSVTLGRLCYDLPDDGRDWRPALVRLDGEGIREDGGFMPDETLISEQTCGNLTLFTPNLRGDTLLVEIPYLLAQADYTQERADQFLEAMRARGFEVELNPPPSNHSDTSVGVPEPGWNFIINQVPEDLQTVDYYPIVYAMQIEAFYDRIEGPWRFEVRIR